MGSEDYAIDPDVAAARTLPGRFYRDERAHALLLERAFATSWQSIGDETDAREPGDVSPLTLLEGSLDEPLLLARGHDGELRCLSNVCTHRANLLVRERGSCRTIACDYHGRRFELDGKLRSSPEFEGARAFPRAEDDLARAPLARLGPLLFASLAPERGFEEQIAPLVERCGWMPFAGLEPAPERARDFVFDASWALYVDNYLEGFHIPWLHAGLAAAVDFGSYATELYDRASVQVALARDGVVSFEPPGGARDSGRRVAAYYWWLWPNQMLNLYPWGVSLNVVEPRGVGRTVVRFRAYVWRRDLLESGAGSGLDEVEREDEAAVERVQRGVRARLYDRGRYSPSREQGVHHFHRRIAETLSRSPGESAAPRR